MKGATKIVIALFICFSVSASAFGGEIKASPWAAAVIENASKKGYIPDELLKRADTEASRKDFSALIMQFYEKETGSAYVPKNKNMFTDTNDSKILAAVELGFFSGVSQTKFDPNGKVTREQMATVMFRFFKKTGVKLNSSSSEVKFGDKQQISSWAEEAVSVLSQNGILNGDANNNFNPKASASIEQIVVVFMQPKGAVTFKSPTGAEAIKIKNTEISLGEDKNKVILKLGQPDRVDFNIYGFERYVYNKDYENFIMVGIRDDSVAEIYTNSKNFKYAGVNSSTTYKSMNFKDFSIHSNEKAEYTNRAYNIIYYFDVADNSKVDAIYLSVSGLTADEKFYSSENERYVERELLDIVNSRRAKSGINTLQSDPYLAVVAKAHSSELKSFLRSDYYSMKGLSPFERMDKAGIKYRVASENISTEISKDAIDVYTWWMNNVSTRINILDSNFSHAGIGCVSSNVKKRFYTTMDLIGN